ncbi:anthrone oxygenase family protein [Streptomyces sp. NPDC093707]|uniref:anthrone oxygenase family protein n=1 Tax=Streptomyces sp. NPDC093707 TaxID=3154984 RepID=UPI00344BFE4B
MDGNGVRTASLVAATLTTGLMAGLLYGYACSVMPALRRVDDRTFIEVMQRINVAILNGWFFLGFLGTLLLTGLTLVLHLVGGPRPGTYPVAAAFVLYLAVLGVTRGFNIRLNAELAAAGPPAQLDDPAPVRHRFEDPWVRWHLVRTVLATLALACLCWALTLD